MKITIIKKGDMRRGCQTNKKILIRVDTNIEIKYKSKYKNETRKRKPKYDFIFKISLCKRIGKSCPLI